MQKFFSRFKFHYHRTDKTGLSVFGRGIHFDWEALLSLFMITVLIIVLINMKIFLQIRAGDIFKVNQVTETKTVGLDRKKLADTLAFFQSKIKTTDSVKGELQPLVDPAL